MCARLVWARNLARWRKRGAYRLCRRPLLIPPRLRAKARPDFSPVGEWGATLSGKVGVCFLSSTYSQNALRDSFAIFGNATP
jgi:hypothetical protein